jgi:hypothetical protein
MDVANADLGMAHYHIVNEVGEHIRSARRIHWDVGPEGIAPDELIGQSIAVGAFLIGQLQANLYRLGKSGHLRFDPGNPVSTDHHASAIFVHDSKSPVIYLDEPVFCWRLRKGRFHASVDPFDAFRRDIILIQEVCIAVGMEPEWRKVYANELLRILYHFFEKPKMKPIPISVLLALTKSCVFQKYGISWLWLWRQILNRLRFGTPYRISNS